MIISGSAQIRAYPLSRQVSRARRHRRASSAIPIVPRITAGTPMYQITQYRLSSEYWRRGSIARWAELLKFGDIADGRRVGLTTNGLEVGARGEAGDREDRQCGHRFRQPAQRPGPEQEPQPGTGPPGAQQAHADAGESDRGQRDHGQRPQRGGDGVQIGPGKQVPVREAVRRANEKPDAERDRLGSLRNQQDPEERDGRQQIAEPVDPDQQGEADAEATEEGQRDVRRGAVAATRTAGKRSLRDGRRSARRNRPACRARRTA